MNNSKILLIALDKLFGFEDKKKSTFRRVAQHFDEHTNENVILIEYRVRRGTAKDRKIGRHNESSNGALLRHLNSLNNMAG